MSEEEREEYSKGSGGTYFATEECFGWHSDDGGWRLYSGRAIASVTVPNSKGEEKKQVFTIFMPYYFSEEEASLRYREAIEEMEEFAQFKRDCFSGKIETTVKLVEHNDEEKAVAEMFGVDLTDPDTVFISEVMRRDKERRMAEEEDFQVWIDHCAEKVAKELEEKRAAILARNLKVK